MKNRSDDFLELCKKTDRIVSKLLRGKDFPGTDFQSYIKAVSKDVYTKMYAGECKDAPEKSAEFIVLRSAIQTLEARAERNGFSPKNQPGDRELYKIARKSLKRCLKKRYITDAAYQKLSEQLESFGIGSEKKSRKGAAGVLAVLLVLSLVTNGVLGYFFQTSQQEQTALEKENTRLEISKNRYLELYRSQVTKDSKLKNENEDLSETAEEYQRRYRLLLHYYCEVYEWANPDMWWGQYGTALERVSWERLERKILGYYSTMAVESGDTTPYAVYLPEESAERRTFGLGSTQQEVRDAMGEPDTITVDNYEYLSTYGYSKWFYGTSFVEFDVDGIVRSWKTGDTVLALG